MNNWDKFKDWWYFKGTKYLARIIVILCLLGAITIVIYPVPFSWGVLFTRFGMILGALGIVVVFIWAMQNVE